MAGGRTRQASRAEFSRLQPQIAAESPLETCRLMACRTGLYEGIYLAFCLCAAGGSPTLDVARL